MSNPSPFFDLQLLDRRHRIVGSYSPSEVTDARSLFPPRVLVAEFEPRPGRWVRYSLSGRSRARGTGPRVPSARHAAPPAGPHGLVSLRARFWLAHGPEAQAGGQEPQPAHRRGPEAARPAAGPSLRSGGQPGGRLRERRAMGV